MIGPVPELSVLRAPGSHGLPVGDPDREVDAAGHGGRAGQCALDGGELQVWGRRGGGTFGSMTEEDASQWWVCIINHAHGHAVVATLKIVSLMLSKRVDRLDIIQDSWSAHTQSSRTEPPRSLSTDLRRP